MAEFKIPGHGEICWRELATTDLGIAFEFYSKLFGWTLTQSKVTAMKYKEIQMNNVACGGMMAIDEKWGPEPPPSSWTSYIAVTNADETVRKIVDNGGSIRVSPFDAPGVGRIAIAADPSGANFAIIQFVQSSKE